MKNLSERRASGRGAWLLALLAVVLAAACCFLPFLRFSSQMYVKRSPNTFVGMRNTRPPGRRRKRSWKPSGPRGSKAAWKSR